MRRITEMRYYLYLFFYVSSVFYIVDSTSRALKFISNVRGDIPKMCGLNTQSVKYLIFVGEEFVVRKVTGLGSTNERD